MARDLKACLSHNSDDWRTPTLLFNNLMARGFIDTFKFHSVYDEFDKVYHYEKLFCNPPFSRLKDLPKWVEKQLSNNCFVLLLIPSRTDTKYFRDFLKFGPLVYFITGRLHFNDSGSAPFPTLFLLFSPHSYYDAYHCGTWVDFLRTLSSLHLEC